MSSSRRADTIESQVTDSKLLKYGKMIKFQLDIQVAMCWSLRFVSSSQDVTTVSIGA